MSAPRMSAKDYRDFLLRRFGKEVKVPDKWSGPEQRYFYGVLRSSGDYEGETLRITPDEVEKHEYTPDFVTQVSIDAGEIIPMFKGDPIQTKVYHEVKGNYRLQSQDAARLRWCFAAIAHPEAIFVWAKEQSKARWAIEIWFDGGRTRVKARGVVGYTIEPNGGVTWRK